jgi:hypothetical protein
VHLCLRIAALVVAAAVAAPAGAAVLPLQATYTISAGGLPPLGITGSGIGSSNGFGGSSSIPAGVFAGNAAASVPIVPTFVGLTSLSIPADSVNHGAATLSPGGAFGLSGSVFFNGSTGPLIPIFPYGGGGPDIITIMGGLPFKVVGATWQYDAAKVFTGMGSALANAISASATAYDNRTANGVGTVQLVAPGRLLISNGSLGDLPVFATLTLTYTPEPGTLVLLATGVAALAAIGRKRTGDL